ncbi:hypothetical protein PGT21_020392 [Puccinia graminis f. sp. tritici]|uniref:TNFR-Cys domain-containing protein n=1 Tax=Puccinia graminis f. sp. tritici TaxID=56615 RepID=A0A5B0MRT7_PUCGR|nr:hypothetical protein PGTUg99_007591 [Puccinia graminis f. sp. tritici]KAA1084188.1 hypothetical protein PGT21_020392 [Puccinia graminis f. sp. tritici]
MRLTHKKCLGKTLILLAVNFMPLTSTGICPKDCETLAKFPSILDQCGEIYSCNNCNLYERNKQCDTFLSGKVHQCPKHCPNQTFFASQNCVSHHFETCNEHSHI